MTSLILDTSSQQTLLSLIDGHHLIDIDIHLHANQLSGTLIPAIQELLNKNALTFSQIKKVFIGMGPGSYTGTRVGVAVAKALSFGLNVPFAGFCSLLAFLPDTFGPFAVILPSKLKQFYLVKGVQTQDKIAIETSALLNPEELISYISETTILCCDTPQLLPSELKDRSCAPLTPNLSALARYLTLNTSTLDQNSELIYLHTAQ